MKILLIEDNIETAELLKAWLHEFGEEKIEVCHDAETALELYREEFFPLIIVDVALPGMSGLEFSRKIRELPWGKDSVILVETGAVETKNLKILLQVQADDYVKKPIDYDEFKIRFEIAKGRANDRLQRKKAERELRDIHEKLEQKIELRTAELTLTNEHLKKEIRERKKVEEKLRKSEERYRRINENIADIIFAADAEGKITFISGAVEKLFGRTYEELLGRNLLEITSSMIYIPPEDRETLMENYENFLKNKSDIRQYEFGMRLKGELHYFEHREKRQKDDSGNIIGSIGVIRDVTGRKKAQQSLKKSEEQLKAVVESSLDAIVQVDEKGEITLFNPAAEELFQYSSEEIFGQPLSILLRNEFGNIHQQRVQRFLGKGIGRCGHIGKRSEFWFRRKDRSLFQGEITMTGARSNERRFLVATIHDITNRKAMQEKLRKSEEKYRQIFENMQDVYCETALDGEILEISPSIEKISKYRRQELIGDNIYNFYPQKSQRDQLLNELKENNFLHDYEITLEDKDGGQKIFSSNLRLIRDGDGNPEKIVTSLSDITERKKTELELEQQKNLMDELFSGFQEGIAIIGDNDRIIFCNPGFARIFDEQIYQIIDKKLTSFVPDESYSILLKEREKQKRGETSRYEIPIITAKEQKKYVRIISSPRFDEDKNYLGEFFGVLDVTERKKMELKLTESEEKYRTLYQNTPVMLHSIDKDGRIISVSNYWLEHLGYDYKEVNGHFLTEFLTIDSRKYARETGLPELFKSGYCRDIPYQFVKKNGEVIDVLFSAICETNGKAEQNRSLGVLIDVTKQKRAEKALRKSQEKYRNLVETVNDWIWEIDKNGIITYTSPRVYDIIGYRADELLGTNFTNWMPTKARGKNWIFFKKILKKKESFKSYENILIHKNGHEVYTEVSGVPFFDPDGNLLGYRGVDRDVTARKKAEKALRESEEKFSKAFRSSPAVMAISTLEDGRYIDVNQSFLDNLGFTREEVIGKTSRELNIFVDYKIRENLREKLKKHNKIYSIDVEIHTKNNGKRIGAFSVEKIKLQGEDCLLTVMQDITERKEAERILRETKNKFQELSEAKDKFFSIIAHDLTGPAGMMVTTTNILIDKFERVENDKKREFIERMSVQASRLNALIENLLQWARAQRGKILYNPEELDLLAIVEYNIYLLNPLAVAKNIELVTKVKEETTIFGDENLLNTIVRNLISNSIKFTEKGIVTIDAEFQENFVQISVADTGLGIPADDINKLFKIDVHYTRIGTSQEKGTGLGLILCKEFVERHGGKIWCESEEGKGTIFYFTIPKAKK